MSQPRIPRPSRHRSRIAVDFDGVIYDNSEGWNDGRITGGLMPGAFSALRELSLNHKLVIFTARYDLDAVRRWLVSKHISHFFIDVTNRKPEAEVYLDDRAMKFVSWPRALEELR